MLISQFYESRQRGVSPTQSPVMHPDVLALMELDTTIQVTGLSFKHQCVRLRLDANLLNTNLHTETDA